MGIIDTLTAGYNTLNRRIWILVVPVALDLFLWLGPRMVTSPDLVALAASTEPRYAEQMGNVQHTLGGFNFFFLLALYMPSLVTKVDHLPAPLGAEHVLRTPDALALAFVALFLGSLWLGCFYLALLAQMVRDGQAHLGRALVRVWLYWLRCLGLIVIAVAIGALMVLPSMLLMAEGGPVEGSVGRLMLGVAQLMLIWAALYCFFAVNALVLNDVGPLRAMSYSIAVTRHNLLATLGLIFLIGLIWVGTPLAWQAIASNPLGLLAGIVGNAYIGSGLVLASLIFYHERFQRWNDPHSRSAVWRS